MHWSSQFIRGQCIRLSMLFVADITQAFVRATNNMKYYITIVWNPLLALCSLHLNLHLVVYLLVVLVLVFVCVFVY